MILRGNGTISKLLDLQLVVFMPSVQLYDKGVYHMFIYYKSTV